MPHYREPQCRAIGHTGAVLRRAMELPGASAVAERCRCAADSSP